MRTCFDFEWLTVMPHREMLGFLQHKSTSEYYHPIVLCSEFIYLGTLLGMQCNLYSVFHFSCFNAFFCLQVQVVLNKLYENKKIASATHNIYAYRYHVFYHRKINISTCKVNFFKFWSRDKAFIFQTLFFLETCQCLKNSKFSDRYFIV